MKIANQAQKAKRNLGIAILLLLVVAIAIGIGVTYAGFTNTEQITDQNGTSLTIGADGQRA